MYNRTFTLELDRDVERFYNSLLDYSSRKVKINIIRFNPEDEKYAINKIKNILNNTKE